jgi:O-antigen/teichoic acid export membrane protein
VFNLKKIFRPYKVLASNFTSLTILQISNYLFPIILLPYLVRVLGVEKYGLISFAIAFHAYFITLCEYHSASYLGGHGPLRDQSEEVISSQCQP